MIHTITAHAPDDHGPMGDRRVFGYFPTRAEAIDRVSRDEGCMHECLYQWLVVESFEPGIHPLAMNEEWFSWDGDKWVCCDQPAFAKGLVNWALG